MRIFTVAAGCAAMGSFIMSCFDNTVGAPDAGSTGMSQDSANAIIERFCDAATVSFCDAEFACCKNPLLIEGGSTVESCKKRHASSDTIDLSFCWSPSAKENVAAGLRAGTVVFDEAQFDTCLARLKSLSAGGTACIEPPVDVLTLTCRAAFRGQVAPGGACESILLFPQNNAFQCKDGICEDGKCVPFLKTGDACFTYYESAIWTENAYCNFLTQETCRPTLDPLGDGGTGDGTGTCGPKGEIGDACHPGYDFECKSQTCDATGTCVPSDPMVDACYPSPAL